jgi:hypothetical protein
MIKVTCSNGVVLNYDDTFVAGDLITMYNVGYYEFVKYEKRGNDSAPLVYGKQRYTANGKRRNSTKVEFCDASYCVRGTSKVKQIVDKLKQDIIDLEAMIN